MKIISISLKNFRQYRDAHLEFSVDPDKNVTLIMGDGATGKTTFTQAFHWCFYNQTNFDTDKLINYEVEKEMEDGSEKTVSVVIRVEFGGQEFDLVRMETYEKNGNVAMLRHRRNRNLFYITNRNNGRRFDGQKAEELVERMLPRELSKYFFFDGENDMKEMSVTLTSEKKSMDIATVIQSIVGLRSLRQLKQHMKLYQSGKKTVIRELNAAIDDSGSAELKKVATEIENKEADIAQIEQDIANTKKAIEECREDNVRLEAWFRNHPGAKELQEQIDVLKKEKVEITRKTDDMAEDFIGQMKLARLKLSEDWLYGLVECEMGVYDEENTEDGVEGITASVLKSILDKGECICGCKLEENSSSLRQLQQLFHDYTEGGLEKRYRRFMKEKKNSEKEIEGAQMVINQYMELLEQLLHDEGAKTADINALREEMSGRDEEIAEKNKRYEQNISSIQNNEERIQNLQVNELNAKRELKEKEMLRFELREKDKDNEFYRESLRMAEEVYREIAQAYDEQEAQVRNTFKEQFQSLYDQMYMDGWKFEITDQYEVKPSKPLDFSTSQRYCVVMTFIGTTLTLAKDKLKRENKDTQMYMDATEEYPLVMDAPLSAFDSDRIQNIARVMPEIAQQWIIFIKDTDGSIAEEQMKGLIGKRYSIIKEEDTSRIVGGDSYGL